MEIKGWVLGQIPEASWWQCRMDIPLLLSPIFCPGLLLIYRWRFDRILLSSGDVVVLLVSKLITIACKEGEYYAT